MRSMILAALLCVGAPAIAQDAPLIPASFEWPDAQPGAIPDLRINSDVHDARETARSATSRASEGRRAAAQEKRRAGLQGAFGIKPKRATTDDETEIAATRGTSNGATLGTVTYSTGATMTGAFGPDIGVYVAAPESPLRRFSGWVSGATGSAPAPCDGIFEWKNGDSFTGSITGSGSLSQGVYVEAGGNRRFVGVADLSESQFRPVRGYVEDGSGRLLAVVRRN
jgi:hypothetical protein